MPGVDRLGWRHGLIESVAEARSYGVNQVVIFPKVRNKTHTVSTKPWHLYPSLHPIYRVSGTCTSTMKPGSNLRSAPCKSASRSTCSNTKQHASAAIRNEYSEPG